MNLRQQNLPWKKETERIRRKMTNKPDQPGNEPVKVCIDCKQPLDKNSRYPYCFFCDDHREQMRQEAMEIEREMKKARGDEEDWNRTEEI